MLPDKPPGGKCPRDATQTKCELQCKYNHFESDDLTIDAWDLRCLDCGWRDTIGFRSDEMDEDDEDEDVCPTQCPYCQRNDIQPGIDQCMAKDGTCQSSDSGDAG